MRPSHHAGSAAPVEPGEPVKVARTRGRPATTDSAETRANIIAAASYLIAHRGYRGMTIKAVAARANVTPGAIYHYFESKDELYREVGESEIGSIAAALKGLSELSLHERLDRFLSFWVRHATENVELHRLGVTSVADAEQHGVVSDIREQWQRELRELYRQIADPTAPEGPLDQETRELAAMVEMVSLGLTLIVIGTDGPRKARDAARLLTSVLARSPATVLKPERA
jgi:AcrR family transcriptional regulator